MRTTSSRANAGVAVIVSKTYDQYRERQGTKPKNLRAERAQQWLTTALSAQFVCTLVRLRVVKRGMVQIRRGRLARSSLVFLLTVGVSSACGGSTPTADAPANEETPVAQYHADPPTSEQSVAPPEEGSEAQTSAAAAPDAPTPAGSSFELHTSNTVKDAHGINPSTIKATATEAAIKFVVVDKEKAPLRAS